MPKEKLKWTVYNTGKLIELYQQYPLLWDRENKEHRNRYKKLDALKEIGKRFSVSAEEVERKIKNINTQYLREARIYKALEKSGDGASFNSKWFGYGLLSFLQNKIKPSEAQETGQLYDQNTEESSQNGLQDEASIKDYESSESEEEPEEKPSKQTDTAMHKVLDCMKMVLETTNRRDEYSIYGDYIAHKLRNCKRKNSDIEAAQQQIENIIHNLASGKSVTRTNTATATKDNNNQQNKEAMSSTSTSFQLSQPPQPTQPPQLSQPSMQNIVTKIEVDL